MKKNKIDTIACFCLVILTLVLVGLFVDSHVSKSSSLKEIEDQAYKLGFERGVEGGKAIQSRMDFYVVLHDAAVALQNREHLQLDKNDGGLTFWLVKESFDKAKGEK